MERYFVRDFFLRFGRYVHQTRQRDEERSYSAERHHLSEVR